MKQFYRTACYARHRLSKKSLIAMLVDGTPTQRFFTNLDDNAWTIVSFNPFNREVCVQLFSNTQTKTLSIVLPYISITS